MITLKKKHKKTQQKINREELTEEKYIGKITAKGSPR